MIDPVHVNEEPGLSPVGPPDDPDARRGRLAWLWAGVAMLTVIGGSVAINELSQHYAESPETVREIDSDLAEELCRDAMRGVGIEQFRVPSYIPGEKGTNLQTPPPWRIGTTVRVIPDSDADRTVLCTLRSR
ncbi:hypothetical protein [Nocardioides jensenii]|uniref:hypothetical protein n=1 Tax=Nocardioides jensenii TaxID=1843 RepID=UPI00082CB95A|nr:hypothetical protein [Nocardioides jensenii]